MKYPSNGDSWPSKSMSFPSAERLVLATGGFPVRVARERGLLIRSNPWSTGDGIDYARTLGAATAGALLSGWLAGQLDT